MNRVVITGIGGLSPLGNDWPSIESNLRASLSGISVNNEWQEYPDLRSHIVGRVHEGQLPAHYDRKRTRTMSRAALLATLASEKALSAAGLLNAPWVQDGRMGIAYGSCLGGPEALLDLAAACSRRQTRAIPASTYIKVMSHCCAANIALFFGMRGRIIPTCSACTSGSQAIGYAYESIKFGQQKLMIAGGAEELCVGLSALFDSLCATSRQNENPQGTPRPFDKNRDGIVISEGACSLVLEDLEHAKSRGAPILAEIVGFGTNSDGIHVSNPDPESMRNCMRLSLLCAKLTPSDIGYVHAHATATELGDIAESKATAEVFQDKVPVGAVKSYLGHTLGAGGALEAWLAIEMMNGKWFAPIKNLEEVDPRCSKLNYIQGVGRELEVQHVMTNNFAFGGVNTSLIFKKW